MGEGGSVLSETLTEKQEKFCQAITSGMNQSDAYRQAYKTENMKEETIHSEACRLMRDPKIAARIEQLRLLVVKDIQYTVNDSFLKLNALQSEALENKNLNVALKAEELKGKLKGLYVERAETFIIDKTPFEIKIL